MLYRFKYHAEFNNRIQDYKVWQDGYHGIECYSPKFLVQKLDYIHNNPVRAEITLTPEAYIYSSAANYCGEQGILEVTLLDIAYYLTNVWEALQTPSHIKHSSETSASIFIFYIFPRLRSFATSA
jgi:hypothetical protein